MQRRWKVNCAERVEKGRGKEESEVNSPSSSVREGEEEEEEEKEQEEARTNCRRSMAAVFIARESLITAFAAVRVNVTVTVNQWQSVGDRSESQSRFSLTTRPLCHRHNITVTRTRV